MIRLLFCPLSITRCLAKRLRRKGYIRDFASIIWWNIAFYLLLAVLLVLAFLFPLYEPPYKTWCFGVLLFISITRINELVFAFYGEAIAKKGGEHRKRLPIRPDQRIILLTMAYFEIILQFAMSYFLVYRMSGPATFNEKFITILDALYLSGITITTTGYGDVLPASGWSRLLTVYEALVGVIFIAMALAAYIGDKDQGSSVE